MATPEQVLYSIGDLAVSRSWVLTPNGPHPLRGTTWIASNNVTTTSVIPTWAIVMCILLFLLCFLGLLFLLVKEERTAGWVQVSVQGDGLYHATQVPVTSPFDVGAIEQRVNDIRALVAQLG